MKIKLLNMNSFLKDLMKLATELNQADGTDAVVIINEMELLYNKHVTELKNLAQSPVSDTLLSDVDYWKQRCLLAEKCLEESPDDTDITADQIKAWGAYHKFISWAGNDR